MATRTTNLGLIKPDLDDTINVTQLNSNSDILDNKVQYNIDAIESVKQELPKYLPLTGGTLSGDLETQTINSNGNIYKNTSSGTLIIGGGNSSDTGATLELQGNDNTDGVYAQLHCGNNFLQISNDGNTYIGGNTQLVNKNGQSLRLMEKSGAYIEVNNNDTVCTNVTAIQGTKGSELQIKSPNGACNLAINNDGNAWLNGNSVWRDKFTVIDGTNITFKVWDLSDYTRIMHITVVNDSPSSQVRRQTITFPLPFAYDNYIAVVSGITQSSYTGSEKLRVNDGYTSVTAQHTTTGMMVSTDTYNNTEILVIGRVK